MTGNTLDGSSPALRWTDLLWMAAGLAMLGAAVEVGVWASRRFILDQTSSVSSHVVWSVPLVNLVLLASVGSAGWLVSRLLGGRFDRWLAVFPVALGAAGSVAVLLPALHTAAMLILAIGAGVGVSDFLHSRRGVALRFMRGSALSLGALFLGATVVGQLAPSTAGRATPPSFASAERPNVLLLILDTVRAANLSLYGYERDTTPRLRERAETGAVFSYAISTSPWTLPSHASMFTGLYPYEMDATWDRPLESGPTTLAEVFRAHGFRTGGFVANTGYASAQEGLARGFDRYEDYRPSLGQIVLNSTMLTFVADNFRVRRFVGTDEHLNRQAAPGIIDSFLDWVDQEPSARFFAFLNLYDAHGPYLPPEPYDGLFGEGRADRKISPLHRWLWNPAVGHAPLTEDEIREEVNQYDGALAYLDTQIESLLEELEARQLLENTVVLITSDHGEEFGEHEVFDHGNSLYLPSVHVPLVVLGPGAPAGRITTPVSLRDVPATLLDLAGIEEHGIPGASLAGHWRPPTPGTAANSPLLSSVRYARGHPDWFPISRGDMLAVIESDLRFIHNGDGVGELYRFPADLWEVEDLAGDADFADEIRRRSAAADSLRASW